MPVLRIRLPRRDRRVAVRLARVLAALDAAAQERRPQEHRAHRVFVGGARG